ncbi:MAG: polysaccharide deacetylase family protein [Gemmatimonadaceae bacterium]
MRCVILLATAIGLWLGPERAPAQARAGGDATREVAITFDDLPGVSMADQSMAHLERLTLALLGSLARQRVPAIGFVNEEKLDSAGMTQPARVALLEQWLAKGFDLGNHSFSHLDLHRVSIADMEADAVKGDVTTRALLRAHGRVPKYFRHPFLHTGLDSATRSNFESVLANRGYRVAPVTIDNGDYVFAAAYGWSQAQGDTLSAKRVRAEYLGYMERVVSYYEQQSKAFLGREIRQVLLLHANALNADTFEELAELLRVRGYTFVTLDRAVADPAYSSPDQYYGPGGISWIHRWALTAGKRGAFFAGEPEVPDWITRLSRTTP